jgi:hypothetical protein
LTGLSFRKYSQLPNGAGDDIQCVVVTAIYRRQAEQNGHDQVEVTDFLQVAEGEPHSADRDGHMTAGHSRAGSLETAVDPGHEAEENAWLH